MRDSISTKVDFLFTTNVRSKKFSTAVKFDIPVIKRNLIFDLWKQRQSDLKLDNELIANYRYLPFEQTKMRFLGFDKEQLFQLEEELINNGGQVWAEDKTSSMEHVQFILVPNDFPKPENITVDELDHVVMEEWFWSCIQVNIKTLHIVVTYIGGNT